MSANDFIQQFEASMSRLAEIRKGIQANLEIKEQFSNKIKQSLGEINNRLVNLIQQIATLKETADNLQQQVDSNNTSMGDKDAQIQALKDQISQLQAEYENRISQLNDEKKQLVESATKQQQLIDELEGKLRNITSERDALSNELQGKGEQSKQHADEIQRLVQEAQNKENELLQKINECEAKIQGFEQQLNDKDAEIAKLNKDLETAQSESQNASEILKEQIEKLTQVNGHLIERIVQATRAINEAADDLDAISKSVPNATTQQEVDDLIEQIEKSIENIGRAVQGQRAASQPLSQNSTIPPDTNIVINDVTTGNKNNMPLYMLTKQLQKKATQLSRVNPNIENKYAKALQEIRKAATPENVSQILNNNNVIIKNTERGLEISGGRKTKKNKRNKKQKGGFTYKLKSKRRSISSIPKWTKKSYRGKSSTRTSK